MYDWVAGTWSELPNAPITDRTDAGSAWTGSEFIVWGGNDGTRAGAGVDEFGLYADGSAYSPAAATWRRLPAAPLQARIAPQLVALADSRVYVHGGERPGDNSPLDAAIYHSADDAWEPALSPPTGAHVAALGSGALVAVDLTGLRRYSSGDGAWSRLGDVPADFVGQPAAIAALPDDRVLVFDTRQAWIATPSQRVPWASAGAHGLTTISQTVSGSGYVVAVDSNEGAAAVFDTANDIWLDPITLDPATEGGAACVADGDLLIWGGVLSDELGRIAVSELQQHPLGPAR